MAQIQACSWGCIEVVLNSLKASIQICPKFISTTKTTVHSSSEASQVATFVEVVFVAEKKLWSRFVKIPTEVWLVFIVKVCIIINVRLSWCAQYYWSYFALRGLLVMPLLWLYHCVIFFIFLLVHITLGLYWPTTNLGLLNSRDEFFYIADISIGAVEFRSDLLRVQRGVWSGMQRDIFEQAELLLKISENATIVVSLSRVLLQVLSQQRHCWEHIDAAKVW